MDERAEFRQTGFAALPRLGRRAALGMGALAGLGATTGLGVTDARAQAPTNITIWHYQTGNAQALRDVLGLFHAANPDIRVTEVGKDVDTIATEIQAAAMARRQPDVGQVLARLVVGLVRNAAAVKLDSGADHGAFLQNVLPQFRAIGELDGKPYAVPHSFGTPVVYWNKTIFRAAGLDPERAPADWDELVAMGRQIRARTGHYAVFISQGGRDVAVQQMMVNAGATMLSPDLTRATFATPGAIAAMQMWQDMAVTDRIHSTLSEREQTTLWLGGQIGMFIGSVASFQGFLRDTAGKFEFGLGHYPLWRGLPRRVPNSGSTLMVFSPDAQRRAAALRLVAFMMRPEITNRWSWTSGYLPVAPDPLQDAGLRGYLEREPRWRIPVEQMSDTVITARWPGNRVVEIQIVLETLVQSLMQGHGKAGELVPRAEADVSRLIAESS
jgi:ABC-type glycerol-3-phosphate transport system substrate-binding protein